MNMQYSLREIAKEEREKVKRISVKYRKKKDIRYVVGLARRKGRVSRN